MKIPILLPNVLIAAFIASLLLTGCSKSDSDNPAEVTSGKAAQTPVRTAKANKNRQNYRRVKKTYNGQTVYQYEIGGFPLQGVLLSTIRNKSIGVNST